MKSRANLVFARLEGSANAYYERRSLMIIDDERPILITLEALLQRHGYQVDTAPTASQGLKLLKTKSPSPVLLDLQLPDAEGLETLDRIKTELPDMHVIILTAHDSLHNASANHTRLKNCSVW
ncbi:MAG: hypothetical protein DME81_01490 [Verrucomicrobia bacterium]|nr:MAG: hypothetical protein DME81_01490 [Verrucomicrobiota bacterium]